jgi:glycosyltransferase involved in cell wall biosynthesis
MAYALFATVLLVPGNAIIGSPYYLIGAGGMFLSMLWIMKVWTGKRMLFAVLLLAALVRIAAIYQFPENSDINRYIWEGEVQLAGYNPYMLAPESEVLKHLRNENWKDINFKNIPAIYWPFAQMVFKLGAAISPSHDFFKAILVAFDLGTLCVLLSILRSTTRDYREIALYALNPLSIISVAGEGHLESILVFWIMLSLYGCRQKKPWLMYLSLGLAAMTKLTPVIFLPLLVEKRNIKYFPLFLLPFSLLLPYYDPNMDFLATLDIFLNSFNHNGLFYYISTSTIGILPTAWVSMFVAAGICGFVFFLTPDRTRSVFLVSALLLVFAPTFHTWYLLLITPFVVLYRSPPWILLHFTMLPLVFFFHPWATHPLWHNWPVLQSSEFIPFIAVSLWCFWKNISYWPVWFPRADSISVVIMVDDPQLDVAGCVQSIGRPECPNEVIVVRSDPSGILPNLINVFPGVKTVSSGPGRWPQMSSAVNAASNDVIVLLSADHRLLPDTISRMLDALRKNENAVGGYLGVRNRPSIQNRAANRLVSLLDRLWISASGISFGDDAVFFRRNAFPMHFPIREQVADIELSLRMKEAGAIVFIPDSTTSLPRKYKPAGISTAWGKTVYRMLWYLTLRRFGMVSGAPTDGHLSVPTEPAKKQAA